MTLMAIVCMAGVAFAILDRVAGRNFDPPIDPGLNGSKPGRLTRSVRNHAQRRLLEVNGIR